MFCYDNGLEPLLVVEMAMVLSWTSQQSRRRVNLSMVLPL